MDVEFTKWLATMGVGGALAGFIFLVYRKDIKQFTDLWRTQSELWRAQSELMLQVVRENTASNTKISEVVSALSLQVRENDLDTRLADRAARSARLHSDPYTRDPR